MKITFCVQNYYPSYGGSQWVIQKVAERLVAEYGDEVTVLTTDALESPHKPNVNPIVLKNEVINGVVVKRFPFIRFHVKIFTQFIKLGKKTNLYPTDLISIMRNGPLSISMFKAMMSSDADVIIGTSSLYTHMLYPLIKRKPLPFIYFGAFHFESKSNSKIPEIILRAIKRSSAYIANTDYEKDVLVSKGVNERKIFSVGCGVDIESLENRSGSEVREKYNIKQAPLIGYIGRQASFKGIDSLLYAMREVWNKVPDAFLLIAGSETDFTLKITEIIKSLPGEQQRRVIHLNSFDEAVKAKLFNAIDVFVSVSSSESFGISYVEAWSCKKPVIGCDIEQIKSLISEDKDGFIVAQADHMELANKIIKLISDKPLAEAMGLNGYNKVKEKYTWHKIVENYRQICTGVLER
ncbi:MAG TPA: glycosyltransferase family 4 protein [Chryseolinea sp.]|nr:glycosyltransferase family 4 protein [Chryseolinea sp.]